MDLSMVISRLKQHAKSKFLVKTFSSETIAELMGVGVDRLRKWEKGAKPNSDDDRQKIRKFFEVDSLEDIPISAVAVATEKIRKSSTGSGYVLASAFRDPIDSPQVAESEAKAYSPGDVKNTIPDPQIPGIYQDIIKALIRSSDELAESAKSQRVLIQSQADISKALLEERQLIRDTANAAIELAGKASPMMFATRKEVEDIQSSLGLVNQSIRANQSAIRSLERLVVNHGGKLPGKTPEQIQGILHGTHEKPSVGSKKSKIEQGGN